MKKRSLKRTKKNLTAMLEISTGKICPLCGEKMITTDGEHYGIDCIKYNEIAKMCTNPICKHYHKKVYFKIEIIMASDELLRHLNA